MISHDFVAALKRVDSTDTDQAVHVTLTYDADTDPFAVQAVFHVGPSEDRVWYFSRELLEKGSQARLPHGKGDVKFRHFPAYDAVMMCLRTNKQGPNEATHADIALPAADVETFLNATAEAASVTECESLVDDFLKELFEA